MTRTYSLQFCVNTLRSKYFEEHVSRCHHKDNKGFKEQFVYIFECVVAITMSMQAIDCDLELPTTFGSSRGVMKLNRYGNIMPCKPYL